MEKFFKTLGKILVWVIYAIVVVITMMMSLTSCKEESKTTKQDNVLELSDGITVEFGEVILEETVLEETIIEEDEKPNISKEYLEELEFNSKPNVW